MTMQTLRTHFNHPLLVDLDEDMVDLVFTVDDQPIFDEVMLDNLIALNLAEIIKKPYAYWDFAWRFEFKGIVELKELMAVYYLVNPEQLPDELRTAYHFEIDTCLDEDDKCKNYRIALERGHHICLLTLHYRKLPWDEKTCAIAAQYGRLKSLKYMHENECPWNELTCLYAVGYLSLIHI